MNTMKKLLLALGLTTTLAAPAMAATISFGSADTLVGVTTGINAAPSSESAWVSSVLQGVYAITSNLDGGYTGLRAGQERHHLPSAPE